MEKYSMVITTTSNNEDAAILAKVLLEQKLAACVQVSTINSYYTWKDEMAIEEEQLLYVKIKTEDYNDVESCIKANHKYEVPEIILVPINNGSVGYLNWIDSVTR